jgi:hypothetical protein
VRDVTVNLPTERWEHTENKGPNSGSYLVSSFGSAVPSLDLDRFFSFLILYTIGRTSWTGDQPVTRPMPTHRWTQTQNKRTQYRHPCLERDSYPRAQRSSERRSCLRPCSHCDRPLNIFQHEKSNEIIRVLGRSDSEVINNTLTWTTFRYDYALPSGDRNFSSSVAGWVAMQCGRGSNTLHQLIWATAYIARTRVGHGQRRSPNTVRRNVMAQTDYVGCSGKEW